MLRVTGWPGVLPEGRVGKTGTGRVSVMIYLVVGIQQQASHACGCLALREGYGFIFWLFVSVVSWAALISEREKELLDLSSIEVESLLLGR